MSDEVKEEKSKTLFNIKLSDEKADWKTIVFLSVVVCLALALAAYLKYRVF